MKPGMDPSCQVFLPHCLFRQNTAADVDELLCPDHWSVDLFHCILQLLLSVHINTFYCRNTFCYLFVSVHWFSHRTYKSETKGLARETNWRLKDIYCTRWDKWILQGKAGLVTDEPGHKTRVSEISWVTVRIWIMLTRYSLRRDWEICRRVGKGSIKGEVGVQVAGDVDPERTGSQLVEDDG